ncbi:hypothetical protein Acr_27g0003530 [Actinidia rufa]|uniref:CCHC-type domain-containing protein n=1 Tax=Actinidia rufa TaxID=165716 RepID=A0A7J0H791_9ERIC|nr:hypothetical protein Acr_27g0003530 [Actinidia rufa]
MANTREGSINEEATEKPSPGVSSVSFNKRLSKYCAICSKQSLPFCLENPTIVSLDYTRSAKSVITVAMIAVRFILIGPQSMRMRAVKMKPMPMKFLVVGRDQGGRGQRGRGQGNHDQGGRMFGNFESKRLSYEDGSPVFQWEKQPVPSPQSQPVTNSGSQTKAVTTGSTTRQGKNPNPYAKASGDKCYRCGEPGHRSNTCPKRATMNLVKPVQEQEDGGDDEGDVDPYSYDPNEFQDDEEGEYLGRSLVIQKLLLTPKRVDSSQRHKIFPGRCTINKRNDRKIVLGPLKESSVPKVPKEGGKSSVLLVHNEDEFDKEARESKQIFAMVLTEEAPKTPLEVPVAVQPLIKEF